jgi:hypothetical protein
MKTGRISKVTPLNLPHQRGGGVAIEIFYKSGRKIH